MLFPKSVELLLLLNMMLGGNGRFAKRAPCCLVSRMWSLVWVRSESESSLVCQDEARFAIARTYHPVFTSPKKSCVSHPISNPLTGQSPIS